MLSGFLANKEKNKYVGFSEGNNKAFFSSGNPIQDEIRR